MDKEWKYCFRCTHLNPPASTSFHLRHVHLRPPMPTCVHMRPAGAAYVHLCRPVSTCIQLCPPASTCIHMRPPVSFGKLFSALVPLSSQLQLFWHFCNVLPTFGKFSQFTITFNSNFWQLMSTVGNYWFTFGNFAIFSYVWKLSATITMSPSHHVIMSSWHHFIMPSCQFGGLSSINQYQSS